MKMGMQSFDGQVAVNVFEQYIQIFLSRTNVIVYGAVVTVKYLWFGFGISSSRQVMH